jgi:hypothetical protein
MSRRGQSTMELALIAPLIVGLIVLCLQGGILISDQVHLEHFAYEGAQWAIANPSTATVDPNSTTSGSIAQHIYSLMCGGPTSPSSSSGSKYCQSPPAGVPALSITVASVSTPTSLRHIEPGPTSDVLAASCGAYTLSVSPSTAQSIDNSSNGTVNYTVTMNSSAPNTQVILNMSGYPPGLQVPPVFVPTQIGPGQSSVVSLQAGPSTSKGIYTLTFNGADTCSRASAVNAITRTLTVTGNDPVSPPASPPVRVGITGVLPGLICVNATSPITLSGFGFEAGATVATGPLISPSVTVNSSTSITFNPVALALGFYDLVVNNPDGTTAILNSGLQVSTSCGGGGGGGGGSPSPSPSPGSPSPTPTPTPTCCDSGTNGTPGPTTLTDPTKTWTPDEWKGAIVTMGGCTATVVTNTGSILTVIGWTCSSTSSSPGATPPVNVPSSGPYQIQQPGNTTFGAACASIAGQQYALITISWAEPLVIPLFAPSGTPYFTLKAVHLAFCL